MSSKPKSSALPDGATNPNAAKPARTPRGPNKNPAIPSYRIPKGSLFHMAQVCDFLGEKPEALIARVVQPYLDAKADKIARARADVLADVPVEAPAT